MTYIATLLDNALSSKLGPEEFDIPQYHSVTITRLDPALLGSDLLSSVLLAFVWLCFVLLGVA